jgi:hypothetical protein
MWEVADLRGASFWLAKAASGRNHPYTLSDGDGTPLKREGHGIPRVN